MHRSSTPFGGLWLYVRIILRSNLPAFQFKFLGFSNFFIKDKCTRQYDEDTILHVEDSNLYIFATIYQGY